MVKDKGSANATAASSKETRWLAKFGFRIVRVLFRAHGALCDDNRVPGQRKFMQAGMAPGWSRTSGLRLRTATPPRSRDDHLNPGPCLSLDLRERLRRRTSQRV